MRTPLQMTTGRRIALAVGVPLAIAVIGWLALTEVAWAGQGSYPVSLSIPMQSPAASFNIDSGQLQVGPGTVSTLRLTGTAHYSLVRSKVTWRSTASGVSVSSRCQFPTGSCSFDSRVAIPASARADIRDSSGDVTVQRLAGPVSITDDSGNIVATALSGGVRITDSSGDISGSSLAGPQVVIQNQSGDINLVRLTSSNVSASDDSGDITLVFSKVPDAVRVIDQSGNITVVLPRGNTAYNVTATTSSGQRTVSVPTSPSSPHVITVVNSSGDVTVRS
jgi:hypothetical protein